LLIKYIKSVLWRVAKRLSYIEDARFLKVNDTFKLIKILFFRRHAAVCPRLSLRTYRLLLSDFSR